MRTSTEPANDPGGLSASGLARLRRRAQRRKQWNTFFVGGIFLILLVGFLRFTRPVLLPAILALLITLVLQPVARLLSERLHLPRILTALAVVLGLSSAALAAGYYLSGPTTFYVQELRKDSVKDQIGELFAPIQKIHGEISDLANEVKDLSGSKGKGTSVPPEGQAAPIGITPVPLNHVERVAPKPVPKPKAAPVEVEIQQDPVGIVYAGLQDFGSYLLSTLVLLFFLLAYGQRMAEKFSSESTASKIFDQVHSDVSGYLFTITTINIMLGAGIALGLWLLGLPNVLLWGCMAAILNFIPYAGALIGSILIALIAALETASAGTAITAGCIYMGLSALEGNIITPAVIGQRFDINPVVIFLWVLAWAAIWGLAGMLISLPLLMAFRILCSRVPSLRKVERVITL
ncbi:AI-2E family transporter [Haloferula rosea]|uniref:AI-2E family transporter n=1 Tax=Haloferula rosea TaxID=490093 RepID=A0A934RA84_9BACT|nr:AI-2E family transporter [Haloferula rosea]MBK1825654.1 AI-2E family transporter [Haloferula rosea]